MKNFSKFLFAAVMISVVATGCSDDNENPATVTYAISVSDGDNGSAVAKIGEANAANAEEGATVTIIATANTGYKFSQWVSNDVTPADKSAATTTFEMPAKVVSIKAEFIAEAAPTFAITLTDDGNGVVEATVGGEKVDAAAEGATVTIIATANPGCEFAEWEVESGDASLDDKNSATTTFKMPANAVSIEATYTLLPPSISYNDDADLWANTASFTLAGIPLDATSVTVSYKIKTDTEWQEAEVEGNRATISPVWEDKTEPDWFTHYTEYTPVGENPKVSVSPYSRIKAGTGVFAANTYEYKLTVDGTDYKEEFTTAGGDLIPNADMSDWSTIGFTYVDETVDLPYPNASGDSFWSSGNNGMTQALCVSDDSKYGKAAPSSKMASTSAFVMAAGNMFSGSFDFDIDNLAGTVKFGQKYNYSARPSALKVKYHAQVGLVNLSRSKNDICPYIKKEDQDRARIYFVIMDWDTPRAIKSGMQTTTGAWDPETCGGETEEGKVIGYGSFWIPETTEGDEMKEAEIAIQWYDKEAKPAEDKYSIIISCACNAFGDFFTGCSTNVMYVDDFEWVY